MKQFFEELEFNTNGINLYDLSYKILEWVKTIKINNGLLNISILHTSASLLIQENADKDVLLDLIKYYNSIVPFKDKYKHSFEGIDDMPAHIKSSLTNTNLTLSIINSEINLGYWQGIYLFEHRFDKKKRKIFLHFMGD